ncbi:ankyrin repeat domain-containing protein [Legionella clemsonensis]|uniref:Ankyrin repeats (3 copies) n=1 Tax=Legionella clemsonensis TaxID=1867846 RepID=A0A222NZX7_9GAMM|nr:ankyrin repeat domain-containing protein [Legionella clemsonensis]ASQ45129.1 Ankyrin repeats (3 copies) [Legionella clemsonensis]
MFAAYNNVPQALHVLCAAGANPNQIITTNGWTSLILASRNNASDAIRQLHADGAELDKMDNSGDTALIHAVKCKATDVVKALCEFNLNVLERYNGGTALHYAIVLEDTEIFSLLLKKAEPLPPEIFSELHDIAKRFKKVEVTSLLEFQNAKSVGKNYAPSFFKANSSNPNEQDQSFASNKWLITQMS